MLCNVDYIFLLLRYIMPYTETVRKYTVFINYLLDFFDLRWL